MARDYPNLSHHESLRLDYLQKNFHYLNQREQEELAYLQAKNAGRLAPNLNRASQKSSVANQTPEGLPRFSAKKKVQAPRPSSQPHPGRTPEGLPSYGNRGQVPLSTENRPVEERTPEGLPQYTQPKPSRSSRRENRRGQTKARPAKQVARPTQANKKRKLPRRQAIKRTLFGLLALLLVVGAAMLIYLFKGYQAAKSNQATAEAAEVEVFNGEETKDGINILVLGTDVRVGQDSGEARTDSIMVVNINNSDNKVKIVSFMRDTLINIPGYSYEDGYNVHYDQKLNSAFSYGEQDNKQGAEAIRVALKNHFDINIQYYAMIDFQTFATAIDTLFPNGVKIDAKFATVEGNKVDSVEVPDDLNMKDGVVPNQVIEVGEQYMDGRTLLNYARFRKDDAGDNGRVERQQQVLTAILQQIKNPTKLFTGSEAIGKIMGMTSTSLPFSFLLTNGVSVLGDASNDIEHMTVPEMGDWRDEIDAYGGQALFIDFEKYKAKLAEAGFR